LGILIATRAETVEHAATTKSIARPPEKHIRSLDGIRGLAVLIVMGGHVFGANAVSSNPALQVLLSLRGLNWAGVNLFFALSGFLITSILYDTLHSTHYFRNFFGRRTLRIFPLYYGVLLFLIALTWVLHVPWDGSPLRFLTYTQNLPYTVHPMGPMPLGLLRHFWSLAVEEQFYLVWPFVIYWLRTWRKVMIAAITGSILALIFRTALAVTGGFPQNHSTPFCMDALLLGGVLALLVRSRFRDTALHYGRWVFAAACLCIIPIAVTRHDFYWETSFYLTTIGLTITNLGAVGLIAAALEPASFPKRAFSASWLCFFGKYSYGLYVFHVMIGAILSRFLDPLLLARGIPYSAVNFIVGILITGSSIIAAVASYHLFEVHFLRLKTLFSDRRNRYGGG
jgi:peptidoglycan/LPS O-acetylase OafA/YrhL